MAGIGFTIFLPLEQSLSVPTFWPRIATLYHGCQSERRPAVHLDGCVYLHNECGDCLAYLGDSFNPQESPAA